MAEAWSDQFKSDIEQSMEKAVERNSWPRHGRLYVSDLKHAVPVEDGGDCKRKLRAKLDDEPQKPLSPGVELMFSTGDALHERISQWLYEHMGDRGWELVEVETSASINIPHSTEELRGRLDMLFERDVSKSRKMRVVVDVKTKRGGAFHYPPLSQGKAKRPDELQVQAYMKSKDADFGLVLYVDREGQNFIVAAPVRRNDEAVGRAADILVGIKTAPVDQIPLIEPKVKINKNKGPDSIEVEWPWQVEYCNLDTCHCRENLVGALPNGIIGHVDDDGHIEWRDKVKNNKYRAMREWVCAEVGKQYA